MKPAPASLAYRLTRPLVVAVITVWALGTALVAWYVDSQIQHNFDTELVESAHRQLYPALLDVRQSRADTDSPSQGILTMGEVPGDDHPEPLLLQLRTPDGKVLLRSRGAPITPFDAPLKPGFHNSIEHRIYTLYTPQDDLWLQLADPLGERAEVRSGTLTGLITVLLLMLPVLAGLIRHIARKELRSLQWLQQQITERSSSNLQPLVLQDLPLELRQVGEGVNQLMDRLHQALDVERALAANAAHELRTPLASVRLRLHTAVEQAQLQGSTQIAVGEAQTALTALETLSHRTERLLQLSRAEAGNTARFHTVDLLQLATTMAQEFWQHPRAQRRLDWEPPEDAAPVWVQGDMDTLAIALRNLIDNALTYSSGEVVLTVLRQPPALAVRDDGPGLDATQRLQILERHVRGDTRHIGYGLGMSIVRSIADRHNAQLELLSPPPGKAQGLEVRLVFATLTEEALATAPQPLT
ncbi:ATP-binding protein [Comamonas sp. 17RB]|uniref:ATP-binding protein n=1 Tax=Comamonas sp. 17RB TaxID=3047025 RepID=UPI0024B828D2|nr:ATP-binding protein [Comamonas sp. 17RB]MDI9856598.1 ATP-binding protein [Comamonas sp. 17RB]